MTDSRLGYPRVWNDTVTGAAAVGKHANGTVGFRRSSWEEISRMHGTMGFRVAKVVVWMAHTVTARSSISGAKVFVYY